MGKIALVSEVDALFMEVHDDPSKALCRSKQFYLKDLEKLLRCFTDLFNLVESKNKYLK